MRYLLETRRVLAATVAIGLFAMATRNATDPDLWWHLRTGELILHNRSIFHVDPFSFTRLGQPWINHEWLSDVLIFWLYRSGGWTLLIAGFAAVIAAVFFLAYVRASSDPSLAAVFTVWAALASAPLCAARPQMFSLLLISLFLLLSDKAAARPALLWCIPPLMLLWVNLHGGYFAGLALLGLFIAGEALDWVFGFTPRAEARAHLKRLVLVLGVSLAVVPLNPYGLRMFSYPFATLRSGAMQRHIAEWFSPDFHQPQYLPILLMMLLTLVLVGVAPRRMRPREIVLLSATLLAGLVSVRHLPIFALVAVPILTELSRSWLDSLALWPNPIASTAPASPNKLAANALLLACVISFAVLWLQTVVRRQAQAETAAFPASAVSFLRSSHLREPIFNDYDWGGYLIWRAYPEYHVFVDGRADLYGDAFMDSYADTFNLHAHWQVALDDWRVQTVLIPPGSALLSGLRLQPEWREIYADSQAVILVRR